MEDLLAPEKFQLSELGYIDPHSLENDSAGKVVGAGKNEHALYEILSYFKWAQYFDDIMWERNK